MTIVYIATIVISLATALKHYHDWKKFRRVIRRRINNG